MGREVYVFMKEKGMAAKKKTTSRAKKKRSTKSLSQTHGREEKKVRPTTLDQIWGDTGLSKYGTMDEATYAEEISSMSKSDLQAHASTVGIIPVDNREMLSQRLLREFKKHVASYNTPMEKKKGVMLSKAAKAILAEGR
jgi:hypothetical protein